MFVNRDNWEDCRKYFEKTWIKVKEIDNRVYHVDKVSSSYTDLSTVSRGPNDEDANVSIDMEVGYTIDYVIPKKTIYQLGENAVMLQRVPARMWRKGMDPKNTEFLSLSAKATWGKMGLSIDLIESFVNKPCYYTLLDAQVCFEGNLQSCALTPRIAMCKEGSVFIDSVFVARYYLDKKLLKCKAIYKDNLAPLFPETMIKTV